AVRWLLGRWFSLNAAQESAGSPRAPWDTARHRIRPRNLGALVASVPWLAAGGLAIAVWAETPYLYDQYEIHPKEDFRAAAAYVEANSWPVDTIILDAEYIFRPFAYYDAGPLTWHRAIPDPERLETALNAQLAGSRRAWLILSHDEQADPQANVQRWFRR